MKFRLSTLFIFVVWLAAWLAVWRFADRPILFVVLVIGLMLLGFVVGDFIRDSRSRQSK